MSEIAFLRANIFNRKAGHNLIAGVAYRLGIKLTDWNTGIAHDFTRKSGIIHRAIFLPRQTKYKSLEELLADGERKERQSNSRVGRELLVAIPHELPQEQQIDLAKEFALEVQKRYGCAVIMSLHQADRNGDQRNVHAHIVMTTREIGEDGYLGAKIHQMDKRGEIDELKKLWEQTANKYLSPEGKHIKFESNLDKGKYPSLHLGRKAINFERKTGQKSDKRLAYESDIAEWESEVVKVKTEIEQKQLELAIKTIKKRVSQNPQYNSGNLILDVAERLEHFGLAKGINRNILQQKLEAPTTQEGFQKADPLRTPDQERLERWLKEVKEAVKVPPADRTEQEIFRRVLSEYPNASYLGWGEIYTQEIQAALEEAKKAEAAAKEAQAKAEREAEREKQRADQAQRQLQDLERQLAETREKLRAATTTAAQVPDLEKDKATLEAEITQKNQELATLRKQLEQVTTTASAEKTSLQQQIHQLTQTKANLEAQITQKNQELAKLAKFKQTQKLLSLSGLGETGENWYRFENLLITEGNLREFPLEQLEKIYQATHQLALKKSQELAAKFWNDWQYSERVLEISQRNLPLENKLEELLKIRDAVAERSFREINSYLGLIQQFRKDFRIDLDLAKIPKEEIADIARSLEETYLFYAKKYANLQEAISTCYLDQIILDFLIRKFELNPSEEKLKELLTGKEVKEVGEIQQKIAKSLLRKFSAETGKEPKDYDFDGLIWDYRVKVSEIQERLIQKLQSKGLETSDLQTSDLKKLAGQVKEILKGEREQRKAEREQKRFPRSHRSPRRQVEWGW